MSRIQKVSTYLIWVFNAFLICIPLISFTFWNLMNSAFMKMLSAHDIITCHIKTPEGMISLSNAVLTPLSRCIGMIGDAIGFAPLFLGLIALKHLFQNYRKGNIFSLENAHVYKRLGWLCFLNALLAQPISGMLHVLAVTFSNPVGHRYISIGVGTPSLASLMYGVLILVISWIMAEAHKLQADKDLTI